MRQTALAVAVCAFIGCGPTTTTGKKPPGGDELKGDLPPGPHRSDTPKYHTATELRGLPEAERNKAVDEGHYYPPKEPREFDAFRELVVPRLIERIRRENPQERLQALRHIERRIGEMISPEWRESIFRVTFWNLDGNPEKVTANLDFFVNRFSEVTPLLQTIAQAIRAPDPETRESAARTLALLGPRAKAVRPDVERLLATPGEVRCLAAETLWWIARDVSTAGPLSEELNSADPGRASRAKLSLARMKRERHQTGYESDGISKVLNEAPVPPTASKDEYSGVYFAAQKHLVVTPGEFDRLLAAKDGALEKALLALAAPQKPPGNKDREDAQALLGERAKALVPVLIKELGDPQPKVRARAAESLKGFGPLAKEAVPALLKGLKDDDLDARYAAAQAIKAIDPETAKKALIP